MFVTAAQDSNTGYLGREFEALPLSHSALLMRSESIHFYDHFGYGYIITTPVIGIIF